MNKNLSQNSSVDLLSDLLTVKKLKFNYKKNREQDQTDNLDACASEFKYADCKTQYWNPPEQSLLYATPLWNQSTESQRILLNQLYWVAYYSQIISAEIATIFLNQTAAAGMYALEDFRLVCETLDFESIQERVHIDAFKKVSEAVEEELFGERLFSYSMRPFFNETMVFQKTNVIKTFWKRLQLQSYTVLSSGNAFIASQYLTVRGLRTLNGKMIQHKLSKFSLEDHIDLEKQPIPSRISYHHFLDESFHFNSSHLIGSEIVKSLKTPTKFESLVANMGIAGSLRDHSNFSIAVNGIFWYDPAIYKTIFQLLTSDLFKMDKKEALHMIEMCFCKENEAIHLSYKTHQTAKESYINYLDSLNYVSKENKLGGQMRYTTIEKYLLENQANFKQFKRKAA